MKKKKKEKKVEQIEKPESYNNFRLRLQNGNIAKIIFPREITERDYELICNAIKGSVDFVGGKNSKAKKMEKDICNLCLSEKKLQANGQYRCRCAYGFSG
ncbi:MAG: hypothetical protein CL811_12355 [Colwelliaceae bacterium]|jgi:hypothetical protein|nr:hypothetical protein [Colwelliaceae bacterium]|tara:strand:+ start:257 stop:556 length:300 start_codon:yes stop_codon:yes gene_type:complete